MSSYKICSVFFFLIVLKIFRSSYFLLSSSEFLSWCSLYLQSLTNNYVRVFELYGCWLANCYCFCVFVFAISFSLTVLRISNFCADNIFMTLITWIMQVKDKICVQIAETEGHTLRLFLKFFLSYLISGWSLRISFP